MNLLTLTALICAACLLVGLLVAQRMSFPTEEPTHMNIDLLETKLDALCDEVVAGRMTSQTRRAIAHTLLRYTATIAEMERLLRKAPAVSTDGAELIATSEAPELTIYVRPGHMSAWRAVLGDREFADIGISDTGLATGFEFRGPFVVRLAYKPAAPAVGKLREVAA